MCKAFSFSVPLKNLGISSILKMKFFKSNNYEEIKTFYSKYNVNQIYIKNVKILLEFIFENILLPRTNKRQQKITIFISIISSKRM